MSRVLQKKEPKETQEIMEDQKNVSSRLSIIFLKQPFSIPLFLLSTHTQPPTTHLAPKETEPNRNEVQNLWC